MSTNQFILVTGATGFVGAHVVDELLRRGFRVRATTRSAAKGEEMRKARPDAADRLEFVVVGDLGAEGGFDQAVRGLDGIIHCAAPVTATVEDAEKDMILPAIGGVNAILNAASREPTIKRIVFTSSFATVLDVQRGWAPGWTYTAEQWNPITYEQAKVSKDIQAYRGAKKFSELYAWDYIRDNKPHFDFVSIIPPMVYGPIVQPLAKISDLNMSSMDLWDVASGKDYPEQRVPVWVDVRDLAQAHVQALITPEASNRRFTIAAPEKWSMQRVADILRQEFEWAKDVVKEGEEGAAFWPSYTLDGATAGQILGVSYRSFKESVVDAIKQFKEIERSSRA